MKQEALFLSVGAALLLCAGSLSAATNVVLIGNYFFNPTNLTINVGDTVLWTNTTAATVVHDSTSTNAAFPWASGPLNNTTRTFSLTFTNAGTFPYMCATHVLAFNPANRHPEQTGTVSVLNVTLPPPVLTEPTRLPDGGFRFTVQGIAGQSYTTEVSSNLTSWSPLLTNLAPASSFNVTDSTAPGVLLRYYRAHQGL
jgi:plastocyanin